MNTLYWPTLLMVVVGITMFGFGYPLWKGKIPPNVWYGFRTKRTLSDRELWYTVNRVTGRDMMLAGSAMFVVSGVVFILGSRIPPQVGIVLMVAVALLSVSLMAIHGAMYLYKN